MPKPKRVLYIADDHPIIHEGLIHFFEDKFEEIACFYNGKEVLDSILEKQPSHLILDINLPIFSGLEILQELKKCSYEIKTIVFTMYNSISLLEKCDFLGANGYVLKTTSNSEILTAFESEEFYVGEDIKNHKSENDFEAPPFITRREKEIIHLIAKDFSSKQIANELDLSEHTVTTHRRNLRSKLNVFTTAGLVTYAYENGLIRI